MEGNGEGHGAREPARGITHACYLTPKRYRYPCVLRNARLSIRALSAFAIVRVAYVLPGRPCRRLLEKNRISNFSLADCFKSLYSDTELR